MRQSSRVEWREIELFRRKVLKSLRKGVLRSEGMTCAYKNNTGSIIVHVKAETRAEEGEGKSEMERVPGGMATKTRHQRTETTSFINEGIKES